MMTPPGWLAIGLLAIAAAALSGPARAQQTTAEVIETLQAKSAAIDSYRAKLTMGMETMGTTVTTEGTLLFKRPNRTRMETEMDMGAMKMKQVIVSNGTTVWTYQPTMGMVARIDLARVAAEAGTTPNTQHGGDLSQPLHGLDPASAKLVRTEQVDGKDVFVFEGAPKQVGVPGMMPFTPAKIEVWVAAEDGLVRRMTMVNDEGKEMLRQTYSAVELNVEAPDSQFEFVPPENAQVMDMTEATINMMLKMKQDSVQAKVPKLSAPELHADFRPEDAFYWSDFDGGKGPGAEWSRRDLIDGREPESSLLGAFGAEVVIFTLTDLPEHRFVRIYLELYALNSWDGNDPKYGTDMWAAKMADGPRLICASIANWPATQSFPMPFSLLQAPGRAGGRYFTLARSSLGGRTSDRQTVFPMLFTVPHTSDTLGLHFAGIRIEGEPDESWALDNVGVQLLDDVPRVQLADEELARAWAALESADVAAVHGAVRSLVASGDQGAVYLIGQLGWEPDQHYRDQALAVLKALEFDDRSQWEELADEFGAVKPRIWPLVFAQVDKRRFGPNPPPWLSEFFDAWDVNEGPAEFLREARAAHVLELIWTEAAQKALLLK